ncbi:MAG: right-handed parallel beta-helix repeat-containing protein [Planctomycetota bacterium]
MDTPKLPEMTRNKTWSQTYGTEATLEVSDLLGIIYSRSSSIILTGCKQMVIRDCRFYPAKAGPVETGGYGDHRWINCYFMARPGTNNVLGGDGTMNNGCAHGSVFDCCIIQHTTDDCFNNHRYWYYAQAVTKDSITFKRTRRGLPVGLAAGYKAEAYDARTKRPLRFLGYLTVASVEGSTVRFRESVGERFAVARVLFPAFQNTNWAICNSLFVDAYQRIRICCGPGVFESNRVVRVGSNLIVSNCANGPIEGGSPDNVTIRDSLFIDTSICPMNSAIEVRGDGRPLRNIRIENNVILNTGHEAIRIDSVDGLVMRNNIVIQPFKGNALLPETEAPALPGFRLRNVRNAEIAGNLVVYITLPTPETNSVASVDASCSNIRANGNRTITDRQRQLEKAVRAMATTHDKQAREIIEAIRELDLLTNIAGKEQDYDYGRK